MKSGHIGLRSFTETHGITGPVGNYRSDDNVLDQRTPDVRPQISQKRLYTQKHVYAEHVHA